MLWVKRTLWSWRISRQTLAHVWSTQRPGTTCSANPFGLLRMLEESSDRRHEVLLAVEPDYFIAEDKIGLDRWVVVGDHESAGCREVEQARLDQRISAQTAMKNHNAEC